MKFYDLEFENLFRGVRIANETTCEVTVHGYYLLQKTIQSRAVNSQNCREAMGTRCSNKTFAFSTTYGACNMLTNL